MACTDKLRRVPGFWIATPRPTEALKPSGSAFQAAPRTRQASMHGQKPLHATTCKRGAPAIAERAGHSVGGGGGRLSCGSRLRHAAFRVRLRGVEERLHKRDRVILAVRQETAGDMNLLLDGE